MKDLKSELEINYEDIKLMEFSNNEELLIFLKNLGCDISRIKEENNILKVTASWKPWRRMVNLSQNRNWRVVFDTVAKLLLEDTIKWLIKTEADYVKEKTLEKARYHIKTSELQFLGDPTYPSLLQNILHPKKWLNEILWELDLWKDEVCWFLKKRTNNKGWYIDTTNPLIQEKNNNWYQWNIPIIPNNDWENLLIWNSVQEWDFVVARIENNKIVELFDEWYLSAV